MHRESTYALFSVLAGCLVLFGMAHVLAEIGHVAPVTDVVLTGTAFLTCLLAQMTIARRSLSIDYWLVGAAATCSGALLAVFGQTGDALFVLGAVFVIFVAGLCSTMRKLDERAGILSLFGGYCVVVCLAYLFAVL